MEKETNVDLEVWFLFQKDISFFLQEEETKWTVLKKAKIWALRSLEVSLHEVC